MFNRVIQAESGFNKDTKSPAGAIGLSQLMPGTAKELGVNPYDPIQNLTGGAKYLKAKLTEWDGDARLALASYNAGSGGVRNAIKKAGSSDWNKVAMYLPKETRNYVAKILG